MENILITSSEFLTDFIKIRDNYLFSLLSSSNSVITDFTKIYNNTKEENRKNSIFFNLLNYFKIGETLHSYMLADLLNPNSNHGQGETFLNLFLEDLNVSEPDKGIWSITAEKGRIDILLVRDDPHSVIVIENKSNCAVDQPSQLYRYWYQEIYRPNRNRKGYNFKEADTYLLPEIKGYYKIIYLPPDDSKEPNLISLQKPDWEELKNFDKELPLKYELLTFDVFINNWLSKCIKHLDNNNHRLREYLIQYIELWK